MAATYVTNLYPKPVYTAAGNDQRLAVSTAAVQFSAFSTSCSSVMFDIQGADVMCTVDGSDPTSSNGHRLYDGKGYQWSVEMARAAKFIRQGSSDSAIHASECYT